MLFVGDGYHYVPFLGPAATRIWSGKETLFLIFKIKLKVTCHVSLGLDCLFCWVLSEDL